MRLAVLYATFGSRADAERACSTLLDERLIACANLLPITSLYSWKGARQRDEEVAAFLKTTRERADAAAARLRALHGYEVPCIERWAVEDALPAYAAWVAGETAPP